MSQVLQITFDPEGTKNLHILQKRLGLPEETEVIRKALGLIDALSAATANGCNIFVKRPDGQVERIII